MGLSVLSYCVRFSCLHSP